MAELNRFPYKDDILHYYRLASQQAALARNPEEEIAAYNRVVNFCEKTEVCRLDDSIKRNSVMFWSYNNIGDALMKKSRRGFRYKAAAEDCRQAVQSYSSALYSARDSAEKISTLNKIAQAYRQMGDKNSWIETEEKIIENLAEEYKCAAYLRLADQAGNPHQSIDLLEKALDFVLHQEVSVLVKCRDILEITSRLTGQYHRVKNTSEEKRLKKLQYRTALLLMTAIESRIAKEADQERRRNWYDQLMAAGNKYLAKDKLWKIQALQLLRNELPEDEVWRLDGVKYSRKSIDKILQKT